MPTPKPRPDPFREYRKVQAKFDDETRKVLEGAARDIQRRIARLKPGVGEQIRAAQLRLVLREITLILRRVWGVKIADIIDRGREESMMTAQAAVEALEGVLHAALPDDVAEALSDGLRLAATAGIKRDAARRPRELSSRVYKNQALTTGAVTAMIRRGLVEGLSAKELAKDVHDYISPSTPGGAAYAAMRLARTEINNAFHEQQIEGANRPGVTGVKWNLSGSHVVPDECNIFAETDQHGMGAGVFPPGKVPDRPHPQCFCYLTYETMTADEFATAMASGSFDDEIDRRTKANLERLGRPAVKVDKLPPTSSTLVTPVEMPDTPGDYKPGKWETLDRAVLVEERFQRHKADWGDKQKDATMRGWAEEEVPATRAVIQNGPHRMIFRQEGSEGYTDKQVDQFQKDVVRVADDLLKLHPLHEGQNLNLVVAPDRALNEALGQTAPGTGHIRLNWDLFKEDEQRQNYGNWFMPIKRDVDLWRYVLVHEWGHALDNHKEERVTDLLHDHEGHLSEYGHSHPREAVAELFANYYFTSRPHIPRGDGLTQGFAEGLGWKK